MPPGCVFVFGPFHFDPATPQLRRHGTPVPLPLRQLQLLRVFVSRPGELIGKTALIEAAWQDVVVADNTLSKAVTSLRVAIETDDSPCTIATEHGHGYRLMGPVERTAPRRNDVDLEALLAPHRAFIEGRAALETLKRDRIDAARHLFGALVAQHEGTATMHVGLANACVLRFEATRADTAPDVDALRLAATHAREACGLNPEYAEAWATLGFVLERTGHRAAALAALNRAVTLDPENWRHQLRLSYGSWGEERLNAARRTLGLLPGCPMARLLAATVFVARGSLVQAEREIDAGLALTHATASLDSARDRPPGSPGDAPTRFTMVALHWVKGLLLLARGDEPAAVAAFDLELGMESSGHLYARECSANAWYAIGVCHLRRGDVDAAAAAFEQATVRVPRHAMAHAGKSLIGRQPLTMDDSASSGDAALARAALRVAGGDVEGAARLMSAALADAPPGNALWLLPIEPLLGVQPNRTAWASVLATLCARAS